MAKLVVVKKRLIVGQSMVSLRKALLVGLWAFPGKGFKEGHNVPIMNKGASVRHTIQRNMIVVKLDKMTSSLNENR